MFLVDLKKNYTAVTPNVILLDLNWMDMNVSQWILTLFVLH